MNIPWDLEATPLQIKTHSTWGSGDWMYVLLYDKDSIYFSNVVVKFSSPMQFYIAYCTSSNTELSVQPPVEVDKIWTITKTETAIIITCNDVELLKYLFADSLIKKIVFFVFFDFFFSAVSVDVCAAAPSHAPRPTPRYYK